MKRILITGIIVLLLAVACGTKEEEAPASEPAPPPLTAAEIIAKASEKLGTLSSFHFELDQEGGGTPIAMGLEMTQASGDIARPDKLSIKVFAGFMEVDIITVGEITYMTNPLTGKWEPLPSDLTAVGLFDPDTGLKAIIEGITDAVKLGDETIDGTLCYHLEGMLLSEALSAITCGMAIEGIPIDTEVWIGKDDFLLRQIGLEGQVTESEQPGIIRTLSVSDFNRSVVIELPE